MSSFMNKLKGEQDILALCESYASDYNASLKNPTVEGEEQEKPASDDAFNPDDLFDTVDLPEDAPAENGPSFSADDIELSHEQKESVKKRLTEVLDEIQDKESISEPALEMIVNEVANETSYLSEAEEANLGGPVEKQKYRVGLIEAIKKFINELLGITVENDGELPENVDDIGEGEGDEGGEPGEGGEAGEAGEGTGEGAGEAGEGIEGAGGEAEEDEATKNALQESSAGSEAAGEGSEGSEVSPDDLMQEGVCTECNQDGVVEVEPDEVIQVLDDNDPGVTPISEPVAGDVAPVIGDGDGDADDLAGGAGLSDDTPLTIGAFKELVGKLLTESANGEKSFADLWKDLSGNPIVLPKPANKGEQKTADPKGKAPEGTKYQTPAAPKGTTAPIAKKPVIAKEEAANLVAATLNEGSGKSAVSFLQEAAEAIKNAKKSMQS